MKYLAFVDHENPGKKTKRWVIHSVRTGEQLGYVEFRPTWRKYVWGMLPGVVFDVDCTEDVIKFLKEHAEDRQ